MTKHLSMKVGKLHWVRFSVIPILCIVIFGLLAGCSPRLNNKYYNETMGLSSNPTIEEIRATRGKYDKDY